MYFLQRLNLKWPELPKRLLITLKIFYVVFFLHLPIIVLLLLESRQQIYSVTINSKMPTTFSLSSESYIPACLSEMKKNPTTINTPILKNTSVAPIEKVIPTQENKVPDLIAQQPKKIDKNLQEKIVVSSELLAVEKRSKKNIVKKTRQNTITTAPNQKQPIESHLVLAKNLSPQQYKDISNLIALYWHPPAGISSLCKACVLITVNKEGSIVQANFTKTSVALFDISIEMALEKMKFPKWASGKKIEMNFEMN